LAEHHWAGVEVESLRAGVRLDTLEQLLAQLRPEHGNTGDGNPKPKKSAKRLIPITKSSSVGHFYTYLG